jgi:hypothetical protein
MLRSRSSVRAERCRSKSSQPLLINPATAMPVSRGICHRSLAQQLALKLETPLEPLLKVSRVGWVRGQKPQQARGGDCWLSFGASTLRCCQRRDPSLALRAVSNRREIWDGERPRHSF